MTTEKKNVPAPAVTSVEDNEQHIPKSTPVRAYLPRRDRAARLAELDRLEEEL